MALPSPSEFKSLPHWRINFRPEAFEPELVPNLASAFELVQQTKVSLRGWSYPFLSTQDEKRMQGNNWVASGTTTKEHLEYWRFYQSGQFIHLFAVREVADRAFYEHCAKNLRGHLGSRSSSIDWEKIPGFISILNFVYTVTEIFEFASRLAQRGIYKGKVSVLIEIKGIRGFALSTEWDRAWWNYYTASEANLSHCWEVKSDVLAAESAETSLSAIRWFFERFGWLEQSVQAFKDDQEKFLKGLLYR